MKRMNKKKIPLSKRKEIQGQLKDAMDARIEALEEEQEEMREYMEMMNQFDMHDGVFEEC